MSAKADVKQLLRGLRTASAAARARALRAVDVAAQQVIGDAQALCPVDTGALAASATTLPAELRGDRITATIGFNTAYAAAVHEGVGKSFRQGQAKFLETAMMAARRRVEAYIADEIKAALAGQGGAT